MSLYNVPKQINKAVTTAGTQVALATSSTPCKLAVIQIDMDNTGSIFVGDLNVSSSSFGVELSTTGLLTVGFGSSDNNANFDLAEIWIDSEQNGEGVSVLYF